MFRRGQRPITIQNYAPESRVVDSIGSSLQGADRVVIVTHGFTATIESKWLYDIMGNMLRHDRCVDRFRHAGHLIPPTGVMQTCVSLSSLYSSGKSLSCAPIEIDYFHQEDISSCADSHTQFLFHTCLQAGPGNHFDWLGQRRCSWVHPQRHLPPGCGQHGDDRALHRRAQHAHPKQVLVCSPNVCMAGLM